MCSVAQAAGACVLILGHQAGIYIAAVGMIIFFPFMTNSGAWLLIVRVGEERSKNKEGAGEH